MKRTSVMMAAMLMAQAAGASPLGGALGQLRKLAGQAISSSASVPDVGPARDVARPRILTGLPVAGAQSPLLHQMSEEMSGLYARIAPAVVEIIISGDQNAQRAMAHQQLDEQLDQQFKEQEQLKQFQQWQKSHGQAVEAANVSDDKLGLGSGFVVDPRGLILTNDHVAGAAKLGATLTIRFVNGMEVPGKLVKTDPKMDVAFVQAAVPAMVPSLRLGDSDRARIGQVVCALGNPLGIQSVFTCGSISSINERGIQHTAPITHGNSGGPLLDVDGSVIGINTSVIENEAGAVSPGMGFAIPINDIKKRFAF